MKRNAAAWLVLATVGGAGLTACGGGDGGGTDSGTPVDTGMMMTEDTGVPPGDSGMVDSGPPTDAGAPPAYCPTLPSLGAPPTCSATPDRIMVSGEQTADANWTCDHIYVLTDNVFFTSGVLTIAAGTRIEAEDDGALIITPGARIEAQGHPMAPIVFTSTAMAGDRDRGAWGGIVLLGNAPINVTGGTDNIEGISAADTRGVYGGTAAAHDCGSMQYVRIEFAGRVVGIDNELNGLTLGGCGTATDISFVQMHRGSDDAFEMFGGAPNLSFLVASGMEDDGFDWDQGFVGNVQFLIVHRYADAGSSDPSGLECDNLNGANDSTPRSDPTVYNVSVFSTDSTRANQIGWLLRRGTYGTLANIIMHGFPLGMEVRDASGEAAVGTDLTLTNSIFFMNTMDFQDASAEATSFMMTGTMNRFGVDPMITAISETAPNYAPMSGSPVTMMAATPPAGGFFDSAAAYVGAIGPGCPDWTAGWTAYPVD